MPVLLGQYLPLVIFIAVAAVHDVGVFGFWSMMAFLAVLTIGFVYEWKKGALEWD